MKRLLTAQTNYNVRVVFASINCGAPCALPATGLKMVRAYHTIKPCQITMHGNILETCFEEERADGGPLVMPDLDHEPAIGPEPVAGLGRDDAIRRQPIRPAIQRQAGIKIPHFRRQRFDDGRGDIGRVGDDEVEAPFTSPFGGEVGPTGRVRGPSTMAGTWSSSHKKSS